MCGLRQHGSRAPEDVLVLAGAKTESGGLPWQSFKNKDQSLCQIQETLDRSCMRQHGRRVDFCREANSQTTWQHSWRPLERRWSSEGFSCTEQCCSPALLRTVERFACCQSLQGVVLLRSSPDLSNKCLPVAKACLAGRTRTLDYECNMRGFTLFYINVYPLYLHLWLVSLFYMFGLSSLFVWLAFIISIWYSKLWPNYQL